MRRSLGLIVDRAAVRAIGIVRPVVGCNAPIAEGDDALTARRESLVVADQQQRRADALLQVEHKVHDMRPVGRIQISRRLIGEKQAGLGRQSARKRHALLLAARELGGEMVQTVRQTDVIKSDPRPLGGVWAIEELKRQGDIFQSRHGRN